MEQGPDYKHFDIQEYQMNFKTELHPTFKAILSTRHILDAIINGRN